MSPNSVNYAAVTGLYRTGGLPAEGILSGTWAQNGPRAVRHEKALR